MSQNNVMVRRAYWLASYPKSGNTWVRMFMQAYAMGDLNIHKLSFVLSDNDEYSWQAVSPFPINRCGEDLLLMMRSAVLLHLLASSQRQPTIIKTHHVNADIEGVPPFPTSMTAGQVYLIRDPRDVAISFSKHLGLSIDDTITYMTRHSNILRDKESGGAQIIGSWSEHIKTWRDGCVIRYEDLLEDPHRWFSEILNGFDLKVKKPRLSKAIRLCGFERVKKQEKSQRFKETSSKTDSFFHHGTSGHWKDILSADQARRIENDHREVMEQYGYLKTNVSEINHVA